MRHSEDSQRLGGLKIDDVIGETPDGESTHGQVGRNARNRGTEPRKLKNPANGRVDLVEELQAKPIAPPLVPHTGL
jgi:hypothetical protein